jgi:hypothetical protein
MKVKARPVARRLPGSGHPLPTSRGLALDMFTCTHGHQKICWPESPRVNRLGLLFLRENKPPYQPASAITLALTAVSAATTVLLVRDFTPRMQFLIGIGRASELGLLSLPPSLC